MANTLKQYEKKFTALESIVQDMDTENLSMNDLLNQYKKGLTLAKECSELLNQVEDEVQQIIETVQIDTK